MADDIRLKVDILKARLAVAEALEKSKKGGKGDSGGQPRHPAGTPLGGRWKKGGTGSSGGSQGSKKPSKGSSPYGGEEGAPASPSWLKSWLSGLTGSGSASHPGYGQMYPGEKPGGGSFFGGMKQQSSEPPYVKPASSAAVKHQESDDKGRPVYIQKPTKPSDHSTWTNPAATATFIPAGDAPTALNGVKMQKWEGVDDWTKVPGTKPELEAGMPDLSANKWKHPAAGVIIEEPDGRLWITAPTNQYGGYRNTYPKGTQEEGLTLQQTAIKEAWEETGLQVEITGVLGDFERTTSISRFYLAKRVGGTPTDQGWESQAIRLVPPTKVKSYLNMPVDRDIIDLLWEEREIYKTREPIDFIALHSIATRLDSIMKAGKGKGDSGGKGGGAWETQPRWEGGSPLGGQWKSYDSAGLVKPPSIGTKTNKTQQNKADAAYALAKGGNMAKVGKVLLDVEAKLKGTVTYPKGLDGPPKYPKKANSQDGYNQALHQYLHGLVNSMGSSLKVGAKVDGLAGPDKLSTYKKIGPKPGGSNPGGVFTDASGTQVLVKGANYPSDDRAKNEVLAAKLMQAAGIGAPNMKLVDLGNNFGGGLGVASEMVDMQGWSKYSAGDMAAAQKEFAVHAWLANYDAVGQPVGDNLAKANGKVFNFDPGGALLYRAQGLPKTLPGGMLSKTADEWFSMRNHNINEYSDAVYGNMTDSQLKDSASLLQNVSNDTIKSLVETYGPGDAAMKAGLTEALIARRDDILGKVGLSPAALAAAKQTVPDAKIIEPDAKPDMVGEPKMSNEEALDTLVATTPTVALSNAFGMSNTSEGHNKFYTMAVYEDGTLVKHWGAIGSKGQTKVEHYDTVADAELAMSAQAKAKLKGGYSSDSTYNPMSGYSGDATLAQHPFNTAEFKGEVTGESVAPNGLYDAAKATVGAIPNSSGMKDVLSVALANAAKAVVGPEGDMQGLLDKAQKDLNWAAGVILPSQTVSMAAHSAVQEYVDNVYDKFGLPKGNVTSPTQAASAANDGLPQSAIDHMDAAMQAAVDSLDNSGVAQDSVLGEAFYAVDSAKDVLVNGKGQLSPGEVTYFDGHISDAQDKIQEAMNDQPAAQVAAVDNYLSAVTAVAGGTFDPNAGPTIEYLTPVSDPNVPVFQETGKGTVDYYNGLIAKMDEAALAGNLDKLEGLAFANNGKPSWPTYKTGSKAGWPKGANANTAAAYHAKLVTQLKEQKKEAIAATLKPKAAPSPGGRKGKAAAMPDFEGIKLPSSNSNASSHNKKVDEIAKLAKAGDVTGLLALNYGSNTYAKKQVQVANDALAALGSEYKVAPGQKKNSHTALQAAGLVPSDTDDEFGADEKPVGSTALTGAKGDFKWVESRVKAGEKVIEKGSEYGVEWVKVEVPPKGFTPSELPTPMDHFTIGSQGPNNKWLSSKEDINQANNDSVNAIYDLAKAGDLKALENVKVAKVSGDGVVMVAPKDHPAKTIQQYHENVLAEVRAQLEPTTKQYTYGSATGSYNEISAKLAAQTPKVKYGEFHKVKTLAADYLVLGKAVGAVPVPKEGKGHYSELIAVDPKRKKFKNDSHAAAMKMTSTQLQALKDFTGSSYQNMNPSMRAGKPNSKAEAMIKGFKKHALPVPEGTILWRGIGVGAQTYKSATGSIIQDGQFQSSSFGNRPGYGSAHSTWLKIYTTKGLKGLDVTSFGKQGSAESEWVLQNNIRYLVMRVDDPKTHQSKSHPSWGKTVVHLLALPHDGEDDWL